MLVCWAKVELELLNQLSPWFTFLFSGGIEVLISEEQTNL